MIKTTVIILFATFSTMLLTVAFTKKLIPILKSRSIGQRILSDGPTWHMAKEGTPTMGGIGFILASVAPFILCCILLGKEVVNTKLIALINVYVYAILNGMIGVIDDWSKIKKRENKGLSAKGKFFLQSLIAIGFLISINFTSGINTVLEFSIINYSVNLGAFYYIFAFLLLCGMTNAVNLTDGLDGLASTCVFVVGVLFIFLSSTIDNGTAISILGAITVGSSLGFLFYNVHPAKVFMGDTGSLFFGGIIASSTFVVDNPLLVFLYGSVFLIEALSVILQVVYFKATKGKRLFKMAPLHHHFEKCGLSEMKIVYIFGAFSAITCLIAFLFSL